MNGIADVRSHSNARPNVCSSGKKLHVSKLHRNLFFGWCIELRNEWVLFGSSYRLSMVWISFLNPSFSTVYSGKPSLHKNHATALLSSFHRLLWCEYGGWLFMKLLSWDCCCDLGLGFATWLPDPASWLNKSLLLFFRCDLKLEVFPFLAITALLQVLQKAVPSSTAFL